MAPRQRLNQCLGGNRGPIHSWITRWRTAWTLSQRSVASGQSVDRTMYSSLAEEWLYSVSQRRKDCSLERASTSSLPLDTAIQAIRPSPLVESVEPGNSTELLPSESGYLPRRFSRLG